MIGHRAIRNKINILQHETLVSVLAMMLALSSQADTAKANPEDGTVSAGGAQIVSSGTRLNIFQSSDRAVIDWRGFDIRNNEITEFYQPHSTSIALNRVRSDAVTQIDGQLKANGNIILVNPNGVVFGRSSVVDVNGLVATTADVDNDRFMFDRSPTFDKAGSPNGWIINNGAITAKEAGLVGFVAPNVENNGVIEARLGKVQLSAGETATVDFYGDGLLEIGVSDRDHSQLVRNTGTLKADGGTVAMTAATGAKILANTIESHGTLRAQSVGMRGGKIVISSAKGSTVNVAANVDSRGLKSGEKGGAITVTGEKVHILSGATLDTSGMAGGGVIKVGGDFQGKGSTFVAHGLSIDENTSLKANALSEGHGGEVIAFSSGDTQFDGAISANGAGLKGNGGSIETSGKAALRINGTIEAKSSQGGQGGNWLLDPADITIDNTNPTANVTASPNFQPNASGGSYVRTTTITPLLDAGTNVTIQTNNDAFASGANNGDIFVSSAITSTGTGSLTLSAFRNIQVNSAITLNGGDLTLRSNNTGAGTGGAIRTTANIATNGGSITMGGGSGAITAATLAADGAITTAATGYAQGNATLPIGVQIGGTLDAGGGNILINGTGQNSTNNSIGVEQLATKTITTSGTGTIKINGIGQGTAGNANQLHGVAIRSTVMANTGNIEITGTSGGGAGSNVGGVVLSSAGGILRTIGSGNIIVNGTAGATSSNASGIIINNANGINPTGSGSITLYGQGGAGTVGTKQGVNINSGGTGAIVGSGGAITITGFGGTSSTASGNYGVSLNGTGAGTGAVTNTGLGTITIAGTGGGSGASANNHGVYINGTGATIASTGSGLISVTGTGGNSAGAGGTNHGVYSAIANGVSNTGTGSIYIAGTKGGQASSYGFITDVANGVRTSGASGNISVSSNTLSLNLANNLNSVGTLTLAPLTAISMGVGTGAGSLSITDTLLGYTSAASYSFGAGIASNLDFNSAYNFSGKGLTLNASTVTFGTSIGTTNAPEDVIITAVNSLSLPSIRAGSIVTNVTGVGSTITVPSSLNATRSGGALTLNSTNGNIQITSPIALNANNGAVSLTGSTGISASGALSLYSGTAATTMTTTNSAISVAGALTLNGNTTINAGSGIVTFGSTVDSGRISQVQVLLVGGGGGGGGGTGGGGGGGGVIYDGAFAIASSLFSPVVIGQGGTPGAGINITGSSGGSSSFGGYVAFGGGGGGANNGFNGLAGGSGGGGSWNSSGGIGVAGQGRSGGVGAAAGPPNYGAGGGGGALLPGSDGTTVAGGAGGNGLAYNISGASVTYGGGGGGGTFSGGTLGVGGAGGGGGGTVSGTNGLGGGGGGASDNSGNGGSGGKGVVIIRYTGTSAMASVTGGTATTVGSDTVWTFNSDGSFQANPNTTSLTVNAGTIISNGAIGGQNAFGAVSLNSVNDLTLPTIRGSSIFARTSSALANLTLAGTSVLTASGVGTPVTLVAGQNFTNNAGAGGIVLTGVGAPRWLVYSTNPASDTIGALPSSFRRFSCTYGGACPVVPAAGNGFLYSTTPTLTITPSSLASFVYGTATPSLVAYAYDPVLVGQYLSAADFAADIIAGSLTGTTTYAPGPVNGNVGSYNINYQSGSLTSDMGYGFVYANNPTAITVTPRILTPSLIGAISRVYDATDNATLAAGNYSLANIYNAEVLGISNVAGIYDTKHVGVGKAVTVNGLVLTGATASNYILSAPNVTGNIGTITQAPLAVTATASDKVYDGNANASVVFADNRFAGDVLTIGYGTALFPDKNVGVGRLVTVSGITLGGADGGNYSNNLSTTDTADITKAPLTVTADDMTAIYGSLPPVGTVSYSGFALGEDATYLATAPTSSSTLLGVQNVGTYIGNYIASGGVDSNYSFNYVAGDLTITKKTLDVTAQNQSVVYGTNVPATTLLYNGFIAGEDETFLTTAPTASSTLAGVQSVGSYIGNYMAGGGVSGNYNFNYIAGDLTVTKKTLDVTPQNQTIVYGTNIPATTLLYSGFIAGEDETFLTTAPTASSLLAGVQDVGTYVGNYTAGGGVSGNYNFNYLTGDVIVTPAPVTITANDVAMTYGDGNVLGGYVIGGLQNGDTIGGVTLTPSATLSSSGNWNAGAWSIGVAGAAGGTFNPANYTITYVAGNLTIAQKALTVTGTGIDKVYDSTLAASVTLGDDRIIGDDLTLSYGSALFLTKDVGVGKTISITGVSGIGADIGNYVVPVATTATADITTAVLTISATGINKYYDGTSTASVILSDDRFTGDILTTSYASADFPDASIGDGRVVTVNGISLAGVDAGNYTYNLSALTTANIMEVYVPPTNTTLPPTVVYVSQNNPLSYSSGQDDGIFATPLIGYLLIYLPEEAPSFNRIRNRPLDMHSAHDDKIAFVESDEEKKLRSRRQVR